MIGSNHHDPTIFLGIHPEVGGPRPECVIPIDCMTVLLVESGSYLRHRTVLQLVWSRMEDLARAGSSYCFRRNGRQSGREERLMHPHGTPRTGLRDIQLVQAEKRRP